MANVPEPQRPQPRAAPRRKDGLYTTGDMARLSRNTLRTVRFYEECGLLQPVQRSDGGHRLFQPHELRKLQLVSDLRSAGFSLEEIRAMIAAKARCPTGDAAARDVTRRLDDQIRSMTERAQLLSRLVGELTASRTLIHQCTGCPRDDLFPHRCGSCDVMVRPATLPDAVSVLWGVER